MTVSIAAGLVLQLVALLVVRWAIRGQWLRHTGALFVCIAVVFHGVTEIVQALFPGRNEYRTVVDRHVLDDWVLWVSAAILVYAVVYALMLRAGKGEQAAQPVDVSSLSLPWLAGATLPLLALSLTGAGVSSGQAGQSNDGYVAGGLAVQFTLFLVAVVGALAIARFGRRWTLLILLAEVAVLSLIGARLDILAGCLLVLYGAAVAGVRLTRRQTAIIVAAVIVLAASLSSARVVAGRAAFQGQESISVRAQALVDGLVSLPSAQTLNAVADEFVYRFDGNSFGALVLDSLEHGRPPVGATTVVNNLKLAVPSFVNSSKLTTDITARSEETYFDQHFGLPTGFDYLPGVFSSWVGYGGPWVLLALAALLAAVLAGLDRWVLRGSSPLTLILGMGVVQAALFYERGTEGIVLTLRGVLVVAIVLRLVQLWQQRSVHFLEDERQVADVRGGRRRAAEHRQVKPVGRARGQRDLVDERERLDHAT